MGLGRIAVVAVFVMVVLALMFTAFSWQIQQTEPTSNDSERYNTSREIGESVFGGVAQVGAVGWPIVMGVAVMAVAVGLLAVAARGGGR